MTQGAGLVGLLVLLIPRFRVLSVWGLPSGALFVASVHATFPAIDALGLAAACALWSATATLSSLAWGVFVAHDRLRHPALATLAVLLLLIGIFAVSVAQGMSAPWRRRRSGDALPLLAGDQRRAEGSHESSPTDPPHRGSTLVGVAAAVATGLFGGLVLAPMTAAPAAKRGLAFVPSLGVGALAVGPIFAVLTLRSSDSFVRLQRSAAVVPGAAAGAIWMLGNAAAAVAAADERVGLAVAYPVMQTLGIVVAGAWGILLFGELPGGRRRALFAAGAGLIVAGVCLLIAGKGSAP
ncbi:hypothetical protein QBZ16_002414 [Prototheca wickerhamii]|uniref:Uncharacterized protein n=1 Tax=Prototheca wickerhamii TaxID=3111 RepID=A0AAD9IML7_PROWI|nr:hypothetical protein QBZ16_002414 [Prototheca wickerhamii]